jgi:small subunit ribosomal protein S16
MTARTFVQAVFFLTKNSSSAKIPPSMLTMRLQRIGRKNEPHYRVVVVDRKHAPQSGKFIDIVGSYNPKSGMIDVKIEAVKDWISKGVQTSDTVHNFLVSKGIVEGKKISSLPKKTSVKRKTK